LYWLQSAGFRIEVVEVIVHKGDERSEEAILSVDARVFAQLIMV
jgi:hypothetical protein